jgi:hypothetical protein
LADLWAGYPAGHQGLFGVSSQNSVPNRIKDLRVQLGPIIPLWAWFTVYRFPEFVSSLLTKTATEDSYLTININFITIMRSTALAHAKRDDVLR